MQIYNFKIIVQSSDTFRPAWHPTNPQALARSLRCSNNGGQWPSPHQKCATGPSSIVPDKTWDIVYGVNTHNSQAGFCLRSAYYFRFLLHPQNPRQNTLFSSRLYCVLPTTSAKKDKIFLFVTPFSGFAEDINNNIITIHILYIHQVYQKQPTVAQTNQR